MKKSIIRRGAAIALSLLVAINSAAGHGIFPGIESFADVERAAIVNATTLNVRSGAGTGFSVVDKLTNGMPVTVLGETGGNDGKVWYQIRFSGSTGAERTGYARADYIRFPVTYSNDADFEAYLTAQGFPESYKAGLRQLHAMYPNWVFTAQHTNLDWNTVITNESLVGRNLVYNGSISSWKSTADGAYNWETSTWPSFDSGSYVAASSALIAYYMDPRNFLDDKYVFQFLLHSYDASAHTTEGLQSMVEGTFLAGEAVVSGGYGTSSGSQNGPGGNGPVAPGGENAGVSTQGPTAQNNGTSSGGSGVSTQGPGSGSTSAGSAGVSTQAPSGGSSTTSGSSGVSTQAPSGGNGTSAGNAGVSTQAPSGGSSTSTGSSGVSTQAPSGGSSTSSGGSGVSTQAPGSSGTTSGNAGVSTQAPGSSGKSSGGSEVSTQAPGSVASVGGSGSSRILGGVRPVVGNSRLLMTLSPGSVTGPVSSTASGSASPGTNGPMGPVSGPVSGSSPGTSSPGGSAAPTADYVSIIMNAGAQSGVNPYVLAAMIIQEQGTQGTSSSISGTVSGYAGYYNFFNIEAYRSGDMEATTRGLWYASQSGSYGRPWNSVDKSIEGGALYYGTNYVKVGQDTFYLKKFNVQGSNLYKHQYMTNIQGAASEGAKLSEAYSTQLKQTSKLEFKIPVYLNMPDTPCAKPTIDGSPNNKLSGLAVDGFAITPTFNRDTAAYDLIVNSSVTEVNVIASAYSDSAIITGTGIVSLQSGNNEIRISVKAQNGDVREYVIRVVKQQNGPSYNSSIGSGSSGGPLGPGSTSSQNSGPSGSTSSPGGPSGPVSSGSSPLSPGSVSGPGGNTSDPVSSDGPGSVSSGTSSGGYGPGGSNVTIVP